MSFFKNSSNRPTSPELAETIAKHLFYETITTNRIIYQTGSILS